MGIKEMKLFQVIQKFIGSGSLVTKNRKERGLNDNPTAVLEINKINTLKNVIINKFNNKSSDGINFYTKNIKIFRTDL
jgi:hypothetical protein